MKNFSTFLFTGILLIAVCTPLFSSSEVIQLNQGRSEVQIKENTYEKVRFSVQVGSIGTMDITTPKGLFTMLSVEGYGQRNIPGEPALPVYHRMIEVPFDASFSVTITEVHVTEIDLTASGIPLSVFPAQHPMSKGDDPSKVPFEYSQKIYSISSYIADPLAVISPVGVMRAVNLARVDISPVQYNPLEKKLRIYDKLEIEIVFNNPNIAKTLELKQSKASPYFNSLFGMVGNYKSLSPSALITAAPVTYVIVSDPMFQSALQPFIAWKKKKGFKVIEAYTNNPSVGTTTTSIKAYLQGLYTSPAAGYTAPSFVLFVGDVAQIPAWAGSAGSHVTDLRYCEYTGDNLPEVFYGRFSATTVAELQPQIDKTLEYEKYLMPDPSFLNEAVMVAGADASYQTHSNGQIYYGTETYFNSAHNILSHTYLQPEPSGANYSASIKANVSSGVCFANYTAHCSESGWASPSFLISDIPGLTNAGKYCLIVGNCCLSARFNVSSFAEEQLRAANKGAVGYIGGSNNTYWDEDYWWGCGFKTVVLHPTYNADHIGAYDGVFHDHGEGIEDWFVTQGQMVVCGDFAVEESNSSRKTYYWEIYHLMGDPSLMTYFSVPQALTATYESALMIGMTSLTVTTEPYSYVALSRNGVLMDAKSVDATGLVNLSFEALNSVENLDIVITRQNRQPHIGVIQVTPASGPYVIYISNTINDPIPNGNNNGAMDFGETNLLSVSLKNVGVATANSVTATLSTTSGNVTLTDNTENYGTIEAGQIVNRSNAFSLNVSNTVPDQTIIPFTLSASNGSEAWNSQFNITANAPVLSIGALTIQDNGPGCNNDGILDPGETADLVVVTSNSGHSGITDAQCLLSIQGGSSPYLVLNTSSVTIGTLAAGASANVVFSVTASPGTPAGTPVNLNVNLSGGVSQQYTVQANKQVVIGLIPVYIMSNATITSCVGEFYDSGGASGSYQNSENYTMTFMPGGTGNVVRLNFTAFSTESGYDYLKIYNGTSTSASLIGTYHGTTGPGTVTASSASGALTINFTSDGSIVSTGWAATLSCVGIVTPPVAEFVASTTNCSVNSTVTLTDQSSNMPTSWNWSFSPATVVYTEGTSASSQNPKVQFTAGDVYTVSLTATNAYGSNTRIRTGYITAVDCGVSTFPWTESFENGGSIPACWNQEYVTTPGLNWTFITGNGSSYPSSAHTGSYNACLKDNTTADNKTMLITPELNLANLGSPTLKFWHTQAFWSPDQDILTVYYKNSPSGSWIQLATYANSITSWTEETLNLPNASSTYYIAFEGNAKYGYGVCLDDVSVTGTSSKTLNVSVLLEGLFNGVTMNKARNATGEQFEGTIADQIAIELHNATSPYALAGGPYTVNLNTNGTASVTLPGTFSGSYYVVLKHRNSIETWTANPLSFGGSVINYDFISAASQAYGNNLKALADRYVVYCGDVNQDGVVNSTDISLIGNASALFLNGYIAVDTNGDGIVDAGDLIITDNNSSNYVSTVHP